MWRLGLCVGILCVTAIGEEEPPVWTQTRSMGLYGPVKSVRVSVKTFQDYSFPKYRLVPALSAGNADFGPDGNLRTDYTEDGSVRQRFSRSERHEGTTKVVISQTTEANGTRHVSEVRTFRPTPDIEETLSLYDGKVSGRELNHLPTRFRESKSYDLNGKLLARSESAYDEKGRSQAARNWVGGKNVMDWEDSYDDETNAVTRTAKSEDGRVLWSLTVDAKGILRTYFRDPLCDCEGSLGINIPNERTIDHSFDKTGNLFREEQLHPGRWGNIENESVTLYDRSNSITERLEFHREFDSHGNWIKRTTFARDASTGTMVKVRDESRVITYF